MSSIGEICRALFTLKSEYCLVFAHPPCPHPIRLVSERLRVRQRQFQNHIEVQEWPFTYFSLFESLPISVLSDVKYSRNITPLIILENTNEHNFDSD